MQRRMPSGFSLSLDLQYVRGLSQREASMIIGGATVHHCFALAIDWTIQRLHRAETSGIERYAAHTAIPLFGFKFY